jgi:hypothetical protein
MYDNWQSFYQLTGSASGSLIGLMFLVATLTQPRQNSGVQQGAKLFTTPTVFHLTTVLALSGLALAPKAESPLAAVAMGLCAAVGLIYACVIAVQLARVQNPTHWTDVWCYGVYPVVGYLGLAGADAAVWLRIPHAAWGTAITVLVLLVVAIRNAWDLVTWLAPRRSER